MSFYKSSLWVSMSIELCDIDLINNFLSCCLIWFSSVSKIKTVNRTLLCGCVIK